MAEDDTTKDLPEPKHADTQPNLERVLGELFQIRDALMARISEVETSLKTEIKKVGYKVDALGGRLTNIENDVAMLKDRVTTLEERP